jgi:hypothetical protein
VNETGIGFATERIAAVDVKETSADRSPLPPSEERSSERSSQPDKPENAEERFPQPAKPENVVQVKQRPGGAALRGAVEKVHRATAAAKDIEEDVVHRVQKIREFSSVVLDEAGYDPSLRFVLVAGALFVIFLVLLILSEVVS